MSSRFSTGAGRYREAIVRARWAVRKATAYSHGASESAHPDRPGLAHQDEKSRLERVVRVVWIPQNLAANPDDQGPMSVQELTECRFGRRIFHAGEPSQELGITHAGERPRGPECLELPTHRAGFPHDHFRCLLRLIGSHRECAPPHNSYGNLQEGRFLAIAVRKSEPPSTIDRLVNQGLRAGMLVVAP